ncbi:variant surface glycoprotein [Trypanosoma brucei equiperdum]|uniref:Variant surface glycoprotein n=1 Tax=Trypanosoma brucei equiperdum TaxID=630700 RepID=A0A3L6L6A6_9TRYP|nr:variant surface glycoprotein [Trypanosoma brucei equiperdum]RHW72064.1 variant surface glycoprotein [Trypanosoma brucei equiperdum]RHW72075.1 variant surface glycoprotein [Trypanosoma brucei equiperdum]RHW72213.1 variant surface glycoprotein [Trypanosoma brucei equiperdum]
MRQTRYIQVGAFLLALLPALVVSAGIPLHNRKAQLKTPCDASHYATAVGDSAISAFTAALGRAQEASLAANKLHLLASKLTGPHKTVAAILAALTGAAATDAIGKIAAAAPNFARGFAALNEIKGGQMIVAEMLKSKIEDVATVGAASSTAGGTLLKIKPKLQPTPTKACHDDQGKPTKTEDKAAEDTGDVTLTLFSLKAETPGNTHNAKLTLCGHASAGQDPSTTACQDSRDNLRIKGGGFVVKKEITTTSTAAGGTISYSALTERDTVPNGATLTAQLAGVAKLEDAVQNLEKITTTAEAKTLEESGSLKKSLAKALAGDTASYADSKTKKQVDAFLTTVFGKDASTVTGVTVKELKDLKPPKTTFSGAGDTTLEEMSDHNQIADATTYYTVRSYIADQEEKNKNQASPSCPTNAYKTKEPPKTADECKKHTTEKPCKDEKGCEFDEKKPDGERCFPKAETDKRNEKLFPGNLRVSVSQVFIR